MSDYTRRVPKEYYEAVDNGGKLEEITYDSVVYCADKAPVKKRALVYLPAGSQPGRTAPFASLDIEENMSAGSMESIAFWL